MLNTKIFLFFLLKKRNFIVNQWWIRKEKKKQTILDWHFFVSVSIFITIKLLFFICLFHRTNNTNLVNESNRFQKIKPKMTLSIHFSEFFYMIRKIGETEREREWRTGEGAKYERGQQICPIQISLQFLIIKK